MRSAAPLLCASALALGCGGALDGEPVRIPVDDWSFVTDAEDVAFATPSGRRFLRVVVDPFVHDGDLFLHVFTFLGSGGAAVEELLATRRVRMQAAGSLYELEATPLTDPADIDPILPSLLRQTLQIEATGAHWDPDTERYPGTQLTQWILALGSRD